MGTLKAFFILLYIYPLMNCIVIMTLDKIFDYINRNNAEYTLSFNSNKHYLQCILIAFIPIVNFLAFIKIAFQTFTHMYKLIKNIIMYWR